jgi:hypothetical protein
MAGVRMMLRCSESTAALNRADLSPGAATTIVARPNV